MSAQGDGPQPLDARNNVDTRVVVVGAGFAGICVGHDLLAAGIDDFVILEKADGVGGTWRHNTYPGAACDVPSHVYSYSFRPNPHWSRVYSPQTEILAYLEDCVDALGLRPHLRVGTEVTGHTYDDETRTWQTELADSSTLRSEVVVKATGVLHRPVWPDVPGRDTFEGDLLHTAGWDPDVKVDGKRVVVIGSAASGIQVTPKLAEVAESVTVFQRTPSWVLPRNDRAYTDAEIAELAADPDAYERFRSEMATEREQMLYPVFTSGSEHNVGLTAIAAAHLEESVPDPDLRAKLTPDYELGCKRILITDDWFDTLALDHVELVAGPVTRFVPTGVVGLADGQQVEVDADVVVCATGFDPEGGWRIPPVIGPGGTSLDEAWGLDVETYKGVAVPGFPNFFLVDGPNSNNGYLPSIGTIEIDSRFVTGLIAEHPRGSSIEARPEPTTAWCEALQARFDDTVFVGSCASWYRSPGGKIWTVWPGNLAEYAAAKDDQARSDFEVRLPG